MATEDLVTEQFNFLGIDVSGEVLEKCVALCEEYNVDAEAFVEQWMAFSLSHLNGSAPSVEHLNLLERKEFSKNTSNEHGAPAQLGNKTSKLIAGSGLTIYGAQYESLPENDVISNYMGTTPKIHTRLQPSTQSEYIRLAISSKFVIKHRVKVEPELNELRPATFSPTVSHSDKYASRTNAGTVVHSYGDEKSLQDMSKQNENLMLDLNIAQVPNHEGEVFTKAMFGFELLHEKAGLFDNHIQYLSQCIMKKNGFMESSSVRHKTQSEAIVCGRIECDADARLNPKCVVLQGTWGDSLSQAVPVDLDNVKQYSLFPGQVVVMKGCNPRGDRFVANEVFTDGALPYKPHTQDMLNKLTGTLSIVMVAGPYTTSDNMSYEPLKDLIAQVIKTKPHLVIMTGPFMDSDHAQIKDNTMAETYKAFFDKLVDSIGEICSASPHTKIVIVSSLKDAFHVNIYPTPPYSGRRKYPQIQFVPDPCTLNVNGIIIGVTSSDVLMQISQEEISQAMPGAKLSRLSRHVLSQQSFSPVIPASLPTDAPLWAAHAHLNAPPHLLMLPSHFRYFVKEVDGCVVVNPEHLTKGTGGGTFARILVNATDNTELSNSIAAQIVRI